MKTISRRAFLSEAAVFAAGPLFAGAGATEASAYEKPDGTATDAVLVRRLFLDLAGRLPTAEEARAYVGSTAADKKARLVDDLLASESFADYWTLRFCDVLRVKSEFPINLWPNAVYVYHRRIRKFVADDEPWDDFARALLTASGSNFRDPEANFFRALADRTPSGFAAAAGLTFLGERWESVPGASVKTLAPYFANVKIKTTREWKEEVVFVPGYDRRGEFCDRLLGEWRRPFAAAFVQRLGWWLFDRAEPSDDCIEAFLANGFRLRPLLREMVLSREYARGPIAGGFRCRRLDAELLEDAICDLTGMTRAYQSIAPEPFTFLPGDRRTICLEDGSISSAFLLLFGRPVRDTGRLSERKNAITAKQRLYLFNSGRIYQALGKLLQRKRIQRLPIGELVDDLYWRFYSRPPRPDERQGLVARFQAIPVGRNRWEFRRDLAWSLLNSREFLYRH